MVIKFNVDRVLEDRGLTRRQLALQSGFIPEQLYAWSKGNYLPSLTNAVRIMRFLDCDLDEIIEITEE